MIQRLPRLAFVTVPALLLVGVLFVGVLESSTSLGRRIPVPRIPVGMRLVAYYGFDTGLGDDSGQGHALHVASARGGSVQSEKRPGHGLAMVFPRLCLPELKCPQGILEGPDGTGLNPGRREFAWGATVRLAAEATSPGENVLQKGYRSAGGQFKLQIDGQAGRPSCVLTETGSAAFYGVFPAMTVADGDWHTIECLRYRTLLIMRVDGAPAGFVAVPAHLTIEPAEPLRLGGKHVGPPNDQFHGSVDDAYVAVAPA